ncbi:membrane protein [Sphingobium sp. B2D3A]|uniref:YihY/virulence factor BrkB family protein n=1 Tax=unclassified Sphingobium TaxID=2611147 RepID=UPI002224DC29|nr:MULTISPECIES: YihY/virulence factor BrkB family protein [unclassified Sphingobium]MCW2337555.1 membrane protein [Sphingobium sp. B2D3A]MCW2384013.1 membrane protein [Sphingobium sp. B2D3D]
MTSQTDTDQDKEDRPISAQELEVLAEEIPGAKGDSPLSLPPKAWWAILKRIYVMIGFHNLSLLAAGVAFFSFLAFVPLIASIVLLYGLIGDPQIVASNVNLLRGFVPPEVLTILEEQLLAIVTTSKAAQGFGLVLALAFSIYGAMRSATAMIAALNIIYEEHETRNFFRTTGVAAGITVGMVAVGVIGTLAISLFTYAGRVLSDYIGSGSALIIQFATWIFAGLLISLTFAVFYRYAPDRRAAKWRWLSVGSVLSTLLWVGITLGFGFYVANLTNYNATYGSLAAVVIFLMWLFLSAFAVLIGAEVNSEMERQTMVDSTIGPDRPIGHRGAVMADNLAVNDASRILLEKKRRRDADRAANKAH